MDARLNLNVIEVAVKRLIRAARCYRRAPNLLLAPHRLNMKLESLFHTVLKYEGEPLYLQPTIVSELQSFFGPKTTSQIPWLPNPVDEAKEFYTIEPMDIPSTVGVEMDAEKLIEISKTQTKNQTPKEAIEAMVNRSDDPASLADVLRPGALDQLFTRGGTRHLYACLSKPTGDAPVALLDVPTSLGHPIAELNVNSEFTVSDLHRTLTELQSKVPKGRRILVVSRTEVRFRLQASSSINSTLRILAARFPHRFWALTPVVPSTSAFLTVVDPVVDLGLDVERIVRHPVAATIYSLIFLAKDEVESDAVGPGIYQLHLQLVTRVVLPILERFYSIAKPNSTQPRERPSIFSMEGFPTAALTMDDLGRCMGWEFFDHLDWLGHISSLLCRLTVDGVGSRPYVITSSGWIFPIQSNLVFARYWSPLLEAAAAKSLLRVGASTHTSDRSKAIRTEEDFLSFLRYGEVLVPQSSKEANLEPSKGDRQVGVKAAVSDGVFHPEFIDAFHEVLQSFLQSDKHSGVGGTSGATESKNSRCLTRAEVRYLLDSLLRAGHAIPGVGRRY
jgi:hypothetical protein